MTADLLVAIGVSLLFGAAAGTVTALLLRRQIRQALGDAHNAGVREGLTAHTRIHGPQPAARAIRFPRRSRR